MIFAEVASRVGLLGKVNLPRESRAGGRAKGGTGEKEKRGGKRGDSVQRLACTWRKVPELKLRRCLSPFVPNLRSSKGSKADSDSLPLSLALLFARETRGGGEARNTSRDVSYRASTYFTLVALGHEMENFGKFALGEVWRIDRGRRTRFLSELVLYLTTHQRRAHLPAGVGVLAAGKQPGPGKSGWKPPLSLLPLPRKLGFLLAERAVGREERRKVDGESI